MALVKCPDCGKMVSPRAASCPDCGCPAEYFETEGLVVSETSVKSENTRKSNSIMANEYRMQITKKVIEAYIRNQTCNVTDFYHKANFYDMGTEDVDMTYREVQVIIEKLNLFLDNLYDESHGLQLYQSLLDEFLNYGKTLGVEEQTLHFFQQFYEKKNKIVKKREYLEALLEEYADTGKVDPNQKVKKKFVSSVYSEELFEEYKKRILAMEPYIAAEYPGNQPKDLTKAQIKKLREIARGYHLVGDDIEALISGYEEKSGIHEKKVQLSKEKVFRKLDEKYSKTYLVFGGHQLRFSAKYYLLAELWKIASNAQNKFEEKAQEIDKGDSNVCKNIENIFDEYTQTLPKDIEKLEELLDFSTCEEMDDQVCDEIQSIWNELGDLELDLEEIIQDKEISKEERARRKASRGRWSGGGFGVSGAIKGAATAGAMNMASGAAHTAVNIVGNAVSSMAASARKNKAVKNYLESVNRKINYISKLVWNECIEIIDIYYPELKYIPDYHDTEEERNMRAEFLATESEKEKKAIELLLKNPYNPLNGMIITLECCNNKKCVWNRETENAFDMMEKRFQWLKNFTLVNEEIADKAVNILKKEPEDQISDESVVTNFAEIVLYLEYLAKLESTREGKTDLQKAYNDGKDVYAMLLQKQEYVNLLKNAYNLSVEQILEEGEKYCEAGEYEKAKQIYIRGVKNNPAAKEIIEYLFDEVFVEGVVFVLSEFVGQKSRMKLTTYENIMCILAKIKNKDNKTLLVYAAEEHNRAMVDELINYQADVDMLYQLVGKEKPSAPNNTRRSIEGQEKNIICKACGKKLGEKAKFCNFCGQKVE